MQSSMLEQLPGLASERNELAEVVQEQLEENKELRQEVQSARQELRDVVRVTTARVSLEPGVDTPTLLARVGAAEREVATLRKYGGKMQMQKWLKQAESERDSALTESAELQANFDGHVEQQVQAASVSDKRKIESLQMQMKSTQNSKRNHKTRVQASTQGLAAV